MTVKKQTSLSAQTPDLFTLTTGEIKSEIFMSLKTESKQNLYGMVLHVRTGWSEEQSSVRERTGEGLYTV